MDLTTSTGVDEFLEHYGIKGMTWGVRKDKYVPTKELRPVPGEWRKNPKLALGRALLARDQRKFQQALPKKLAKADKKYEKDFRKEKRRSGYAEIVDIMDKHVTPDIINDVNNRPQFKGKNLYKDSTLMDKYNNAFEKEMNSAFKEVALEVTGPSPSGKFVMTYHYDAKANKYHIVNKKVSHSSEQVVNVYVTLDEFGFAKKVELKEDQMMQSDDSFDAFLEHYGIKGMKWGFRRDRPGGYSGPAESTTVKIRPGRGVVKVSGGRGQPASEDAVKAAASKRKAVVSTTDALTNDELKQLVARLNLEQQYSKLTASTKKEKSSIKKLGQEFILAETKSLLLSGTKGPGSTKILSLFKSGVDTKKALKTVPTGKHRKT